MTVFIRHNYILANNNKIYINNTFKYSGYAQNLHNVNTLFRTFP